MEQKGISTSRNADKGEEPTLFDTVGDELRRARIAQGLSIETVAKRLNIKTIYISALENNDYTAFPAIVYGIGFLRTYTIFLGLETEPLIERFKSETTHLIETKNDVVIPAQHNVLPNKKTITICIVLLFGLCAIWYGLNQKEPQTNLPVIMSDNSVEVEPLIETVVALPSEPIVTAPIESDTILNQNIELITDELNTVVPLDGHINASEETQKKEAEPIEHSLPAITGNRYGVEKGAVIVFLASDRSWINVKDNDQTIFDQILTKGDAYFVPADKDGLIMRTGNARGLEVFVNGETQGAVSKTETVKKNILLIPETFKRN